ncbi:MAG TPA: hypothetical protein VIU93_14215 [Gallionellaceae bacterium]
MMDMNGSSVGPEVEEYDDEVMSAGWNPQLVLAGQSVATSNRHVDPHPPVAYVDIDAFLKRMYEYQC